MSDNTENGSKSTNKPAYVAYTVIDRGEGKKSKWREIGVAFRHKNGQGIDILCDSLPLNGRITLMVPDSN